jgi:predicted transcriptional regulator
MAKRKITVTVDDELVEAVQTLGKASLSSVVNDALISEIERRARAAALGRMLADWDAALGPVAFGAIAAAAAAFDDLDAVTESGTAHLGSRSRRGVA